MGADRPRGLASALDFELLKLLNELLHPVVSQEAL